MFKKILFPLFSLFLIYQTGMMLKNLASSVPFDFSIGVTFLIAFLLTLYVTGIFAFLGFAYPTSRIWPASYFTIHNPKMLRVTYRTLGVKYFKVLLLLVFWGRKQNRKKYFDGTRGGFENFIYQTQQSEFGHAGALVVLVVISIYLVAQGYWLMAGFVMLINWAGNFYPVVLQRYHRMRVEGVVKRG